MNIFNKAQKDVAEQSTKTEKNVNSLDNVISSLSPSALTAVAGITALVGSFKALTGSLGAVIDNYAHFEKLQMGLTTFFQDADKGKEKFEELRKLSNETTFGVDELTDAFTQMANVGINVDSIKDNLMMIGNIANGDKQKFSELVSIYAKIQSTGKAGSMQLQQIAMRGFPIYDMLKKIGVQGTATGEDITKAFQEMTKEGGQFYNAMNNINDTIEGKEGFISDYFKEFTVNFATVTGMADSYKAILDGLREVIGGVSDKLLEWNSNPVIKSIMTGAFSALLVGLVTIIGVSLVGALQTVIVKLGIILALKTALSGIGGAIALGVAGITALTTGIIAYAKSTDEALKNQDELNKKLKEAQDLAHQGSNPVSYSRNNQLEQAKKDLDVYQKAGSKAKEELKKAEKELADYRNQWNKLSAEFDKMWKPEWGAIPVGEKQDWIKSQMSYEPNKGNELTDNVDRWKASWESANNLIDQTQSKIEKLNNEIANFGDTDALKTVFDELWKTVGKGETELEDLQDKLKQMQLYKAQDGKYNNAGQLIKFNDKERSEIDKTVDYLQKKIDDVTLNLKLAGMEDWQKDLMKLYGFDSKEVGQLLDAKAKGNEWVEKGLEKRIQARDLTNRTYKELGINQTNDAQKKEAKEWLKSLVADANELTKTGRFGAVGKDGKLDNSFIKLQDEITKATDELDKLGVSSDEVAEILGNVSVKGSESITSLSDLSEHLMKIATDKNNTTGQRIGAYVGATMANAAQGTTAGDVMNGAMQGASVGGPWGALIGAILALVQKCEFFTESLEDVNDILNPIIKLLNSLLKPLNNIVKIIFSVLGPVLEGLANGIESFMDFFFGGLNDYADSLREANEEKQKEIERQRALTDAYSNMLSTLKDVQEEYEKRKRDINAQGYADSVTGVHDMILTPQGRFSTDPDDYIIATKNPNGLNGGGKGDIIINNYSNAQVEAQQDDMGNTIIMISQKVAMDYANGNNGWDSAVITRQARTAGRQLSM